MQYSSRFLDDSFLWQKFHSFHIDETLTKIGPFLLLFTTQIVFHSNGFEVNRHRPLDNKNMFDSQPNLSTLTPLPNGDSYHAQCSYVGSLAGLGWLHFQFFMRRENICRIPLRDLYFYVLSINIITCVWCDCDVRSCEVCTIWFCINDIVCLVWFGCLNFSLSAFIMFDMKLCKTNAVYCYSHHSKPTDAQFTKRCSQFQSANE